MDTDKLLTFLKSVLRCLVQAGFKNISVITDGKRINKKDCIFHFVNAITYR